MKSAKIHLISLITPLGISPVSADFFGLNQAVFAKTISLVKRKKENGFFGCQSLLFLFPVILSCQMHWDLNLYQGFAQIDEMIIRNIG